jgi:MoaA/NifB/PqqE/SkfB family radical SAM enzyme
VPTGSVRESVDRVCRFRRITGGGFRAALEVTRRCNIACLHCFVPNEREEPSLETLRCVLADLAAAGCRKVLLTGGEPLLREDLEEIVRAATETRMGVDLNSNLVGLTAERAARLARAGLAEASVSFYGDEAFHDRFVRRAGAHARTLAACRALRAEGVDLDVHGPVWAENLRFATALADLAVELGAGSLTFFKVIGLGRGGGDAAFGPTRFGADVASFEPPSLEALAEVIGALRARGTIPVRTIGFWGARDAECEQGRSIVGVTANLTASPCLLSRRRTPGPRVLDGANARATLAVLGGEVGDGLWTPVCDAAPDGADRHEAPLVRLR